MKNKKRVIIYITSTILILSIALMLVELPTSKKKDYQLNIDIESNDNITNPINYSDVITKVREEYLNHLKKLKSKSMYDTGVEVTKNDEILILQTCSTHKDYHNYQKKYLLIILRRV